MVRHPTGTVTFLFTDVEGSTRLWEEYPTEMQAALEDHDNILRTTIDAHGGYVFSTAGDAFAAAFTRAALAAQRSLGEKLGQEHVEIRVRMAVHTGEAQERDGPRVSELNHVDETFSPATGAGGRDHKAT